MDMEKTTVIAVLRGDDKAASTVSFSPDGKHLASGMRGRNCEDLECRKWDGKTDAPRASSGNLERALFTGRPAIGDGVGGGDGTLACGRCRLRWAGNETPVPAHRERPLITDRETSSPPAPPGRSQDRNTHTRQNQRRRLWNLGRGAH